MNEASHDKIAAVELKKPYTTPKLKVYGKLSDITHTAVGSLAFDIVLSTSGTSAS